MQAQATLFVLSAYSLSKRAFQRIEAALGATPDGATRLIRLEDTGPSLIEALDTLRRDGYRNVKVQPFGIPFPEGILAWLPGVLADWRRRGKNADTSVCLGLDIATDARALSQVADATCAHPAPAKNVDTVRPSLGKPGWNDPPDYTFHLLVCTGPRCAIHGAFSLRQTLKEELAEAGLSPRCLTTRTGCIFPCNRGPVLVLYPHGHWFCLPDRTAVRRFVSDVLIDGGTADDLRFHTAQITRDTSPQIKEPSL